MGRLRGQVSDGRGAVQRAAARAVKVLTIAGREMPSLSGADTLDSDWIIATGACRAVVSVGPNSHGHPSETLLADLAGVGMTVRRTDQEGDVVIPLPVSGSPS